MYTHLGRLFIEHYGMFSTLIIVQWRHKVRTRSRIIRNIHKKIISWNTCKIIGNENAG